jgi:hypothetical protein
MIRHVVLFKLNEGVDRDEPRVAEGARMFEALGDRIPELELWQCGWNITERDIAQDYVIVSDVADRDALRRYIAHPDHQAAAAHWRAFATWVIADLEI